MRIKFYYFVNVCLCLKVREEEIKRGGNKGYLRVLFKEGNNF